MQYHLSPKIFLVFPPLHSLLFSSSFTDPFLYFSNHHLRRHPGFLSNSSQSSSNHLHHKLIPINMASNLHCKDGHGHYLNKVFTRLFLLYLFDSSMFSPLPSNSSPSNDSPKLLELIFHQPSPMKIYRTARIVAEQAFILTKQPQIMLLTNCPNKTIFAYTI